MDTLASNYDSNAMVDDGSCQYIIGCTDSLAFNYDPNAVIDDSSCVPIIYGCNDVYACNYDSLANTLVPSCIYSLTPNGLFTSNIQLDRATLNWNPSVNANDYQIRYRTSNTLWTVVSSAGMVNKQKINLSPATDYQWQVRSFVQMIVLQILVGLLVKCLQPGLLVLHLLMRQQ